MNRDLWLTNDATIPGQLATVRETPVIGCGRLLIQRSSNSQLLYRVININANLSAAKGQVSIWVPEAKSWSFLDETHFADVYYSEDVKMLFLRSA